MRSSSILVAILFAVLGCSRGAAHPPAPPVKPADAKRGAETPGAASSAPSRGALDPSEEITEAELASIPEPVEAAVKTAPPGETPNSAAAAPEKTPPMLQAGGSIWRVQIFASQDLKQADRVAKEASARFGEPALIEFEGTLYKVRLGSFVSEASAQALRDRAVSGGFPGAFRMRSQSASSGEKR